MKKTWKALVLSACCVMGAGAMNAQASDADAQIKALCAKVVADAASSSALQHLSLDDAWQILQDEGYRVTEKKSDHFTIKVNGRNIMMYYFSGGDFQLYYGVSGVKITEKQINDWNRTKRLSRAYIDKVGDPALESDLDGGAGLAKAQVVNFTKVFVDTSVPAFRKFLLEKGDVE